ncbi:MAG: aconitase family protein, partial [Xanthobacteraceae bacterium]
IAAKVLAGRQVKPGFALNVIPTSNELMAAAAKEGIIAALVEAGAFVSSPSCDYCYGRIATMTANQRAVSTGTLNVRGRMGSPDSEIYLCNAAIVAATAIEGKIADPRSYL